MDAEKIFLAALVTVLSIIAWLMIEPFLGYVLFALILAFLLHPLHVRLRRFVGSRVSAFSLMVFAIAVAVVPLALATAAVIHDAQDFSEDINQSELINTTHLEDFIQERTGREVDVEQVVDSAVQEFTSTTFGSFSQFVNLFASLSIGITFMLFLIYYFLKDGPEMIQWTRSILPLEEEVKDGLYQRIDNTTWAVIRGHVLVAVAQALIAGLGLFIAGIPNFMFWTFIMVLLGFIPLIGTPIVWIPSAIYLFMIERPLAGFFLLVYGMVAVSLTDNVLRPIVVDRRAELHPAVIMIGVLGGVYLFGAPGLFFGPILLGIFKSVLVVARNNYYKTG